MRFCPFCSAENADEQAVCQACGRRLPPRPPGRARNAPATGVQLPQRPATGAPPLPRRSGTTLPPPLPGAQAAPTTTSPGMAPPLGPPQPGVMVSPGAMSAPPGSHAELHVPPVHTTAPYPASTPNASSGLHPAPALPRVGSPSSAPYAAQPPSASGLHPAPPSSALPRAGSPSSAPYGAPRAGTPSGPYAAQPGSISGVHPAPQQPPPTGPVPGRESAPALPPPPAAEDAGHRSLLAAISPGPAALRREPPPPETREGDASRRRSDHPSHPPPLRSSQIPPATPGSGPRPVPPPSSAPVIPQGAFNDDFNTVSEGASLEVEAARRAAGGTGITPPPTRVQVDADRPFTPPRVDPVPEIPEAGLYHAARYTVRFAKARWQRRGAIRTLQNEIKQDTDALDQVLGALGRVARNARVDGRVFSAENTAINAAEERMGVLGKEHGDVDARKAEENSRFVDVERERNAKLSEAERTVDEVSKELAQLDNQRRAHRDKRKELERRQKAYLKSAEDNDRQAGSAQMGDQRGELRRSAEQYRKEAAALEPDRQEVDRRISSLERPINEATAKLDAAKAELDAAKRSLSDAREGHNHRLAELDAEQKRKSREIAQAESEIARRLVTLGTLVNLNRIEDVQFAELYQRIDRLRGAITSRTTEIEKLTAEREAYDRGSLVRGSAAMGGAIVLFIALIVILRAIL